MQRAEIMRIFTIIIILVWAFPCLADIATVVEGARVNLRSGRADTYRIIKVLEPGTQVDIVHDESGYVHVRTAAGDTGWLPTRMLKIEASPVRGKVPDPRLAVLQEEMEKARAELAQSQSLSPNPSARIGYSTGLMLSLGLGGIFLGLLLGSCGLRAYYQKRLKGLRI